MPDNKKARHLQAGFNLHLAMRFTYRLYGTLMFLLLEKLLPVLSKAFTTNKCDPEFIGTSVSINVLLGEWNTSLKSR